ncbi:hypothetical protein KO361_04655 [Candidatus Woesearchaeota archaeon]|nr:hypothetical protein [Candidatus Woesearchaeota archaeon]
MGFKVIKIDDLKYKSTNEEELEQSIVFDDLVSTLKLDNTKYFIPSVNNNYEVVKNGIFLKAAIDAKLDEMLVEVPENVYEFPNQTSQSHIIKNFIFFNQPMSNDFNDLFSQYALSCKNSLNKSLVQFGNVNNVEYGKFASDSLVYSLNGTIKSTENLSLLEKPNDELYKNLETRLGKIRSINGIKY